MRSCRASGADRFRATAILRVLMGLGFLAAFSLTAPSLVLSPASAQTPRSLLPTKPLEFKVSPEPDSQPNPTRGPLAAPATIGSEPVDPAKKGKSGISVDSLGALTGETVGVLDASSGGFDADLWRDTPRAVINTLIRLLPEAPASRSILDLRRRLLLSRAAVPPAVPASSESGTTESLLLHRVRALFRSGDLDGASSLLAVVPSTHREEAFSRMAADIAFLRNDTLRACESVAAWVDRSSDRYWQKALVFCEALNGAWEKVDFGMRLLIELDENDEVFFTLMRAIGGEAGATDRMRARDLRPLDVAMARAARVGLPDPGPEIPPRWLLRAFMNDAGIAPANRFAMVEQAEMAGIAGTSELIAVYESMQVSPELLESAASVAAADPSPTGRALLFRATMAQTSNLGRAQATKQAAEVARERRMSGQMARVYAPVARELAISSQLAWFAADSALLLLAVNDFEAARPWLGLAEREASFSPELGAAWRRLWPLARLAGGDAVAEWRADHLQVWWDWTRENDPAAATAKATVLFGLLEALDEPVPATAWRGLIGQSSPTDASAPKYAITRALSEAISNARIGEAISLIAIAFGTGPLGNLPTSIQVDAVRGLYSLGLEAEARRLALEIAMASGL
jgi:hypothetical protein